MTLTPGGERDKFLQEAVDAFLRNFERNYRQAIAHRKAKEAKQ